MRFHFTKAITLLKIKAKSENKKEKMKRDKTEDTKALSIESNKNHTLQKNKTLFANIDIT